MEYKGKLYGKIGNKYFDTSHTAEDWDKLTDRIKELEQQLQVSKLPMHGVSNSVCPECGYPKFKKHHEDFERCNGCDFRKFLKSHPLVLTSLVSIGPSSSILHCTYKVLDSLAHLISGCLFQVVA